MSDAQLIQSVGFAAPLVTALICMVILLIFARETQNRAQPGALIWLILPAYMTEVFIWSGIILYINDYRLFTWYNSWFYLMLLLNQVLIYHLVFTFTATGRTHRFSPWHYIVPLLIVGTLTVWSLYVPFDVQYYIVESRGEIAGGYTAYSLLFSAPVPTFFVYNLGYALLALRRINRYRKAFVNYSSDEERSSARWLYLLFRITLLTLPLPLLSLFMNKGVLVNAPVSLAAGLAAAFQYMVIAYNLVAGNYVIIYPATEKEEESRGGEREAAIDHRRFERYMRSYRPYRNSKLRITDICKALGTNRTYLSAFINREYGMNFSRYVNRLRLREVDRLRNDPAYAGKSGLDIVLAAGFSNYKGYLRAKRKEDTAGIVNI